MAGKPNPHREVFAKLGITTFEDLPHARTDAMGLQGLELADLIAPAEEHEGRYWNLVSLLEYDEDITFDFRTLRAVLVQYVTYGMPFARELQGYWTLTALPGTNGDRLSTFSGSTR